MVNPFFIARQGLSDAMIDFGPSLSGRVLDVGCGSKPYQHMLAATEYVGLEYDNPRSRAAGIADFYYQGNRFPFDDSSFDGVLFNQVLEHVFNPDEFLAEVFRVVKPEGRILLTVPFVWDEHEQPFDYARYSSFGLRHLLEKHGFQVLRQDKTVTDLRALFQLLNAYTYKKTYSGRPYRDVLTTILLMAPVNIIGQVFGRVFPSNEDFYLDNVVLAKRPK